MLVYKILILFTYSCQLSGRCYWRHLQMRYAEVHSIVCIIKWKTFRYPVIRQQNKLIFLMVQESQTCLWPPIYAHMVWPDNPNSVWHVLFRMFVVGRPRRNPKGAEPKCPRIFGTSYMGAHGTRSINLILQGAQTRCGKTFYSVYHKCWRSVQVWSLRGIYLGSRRPRCRGAGTGGAGWASAHPGKNQGGHGPPWKF